MSERAQGGSLKPDHSRPKGEYKMTTLLFVICAAMFVDSLHSPGIFQGQSAGPGTIPQLVVGALVLMIIGLAIQFARKGYRKDRSGTCCITCSIRMSSSCDDADDLRLRRGADPFHSGDVPLPGSHEKFKIPKPAGSK